ncbi:MAG: hypothetical protein H0W07_06105 [Chloroflexi bacterium]|nr:hypothetical protein [Chloroflexota bacterium]
MPEIDLPGPDELEDRFSRVVALLIAFATLVAASAGFLQNAAGNNGGSYSIRASQLGVESLGALVNAGQTAQVDFETYSLAAEQRARAANAFLRSAIADAGSAEGTNADFRQRLQTVLADRTDDLTSIKLDGEDGPRRDPAFPARFFAKATRASVQLDAEQDAANEAAQLWGDQVTVYTAILAMLAVSLYLFGLALTVDDRRIARGFTAVGVAIVAVGTAWTGLVASAPPRASDLGAAAAFAEAHVAALAAVDQAGFAAAVSGYDRAIAMRPTFARAYKERSEAILLAGTPRHGALIGITGTDALARSRADLEKARDLGLRTGVVMGNLGFASFLQGVQQGDRALIERAVGHTRAAIDLDATNPRWRFNLAVALLALDRTVESDEAYRVGLQHLLYVDVEKQTLRAEPVIEEFVTAAALSDLETLASRRPDLAPKVGGIKQFLVGAVARESAVDQPQSPASLGPVSVGVLPAEVEWTAELQAWDTSRDVLSAQWYYDDPQQRGWTVIPSISGVVDVTRDEYNLRSYLAASTPPSCLPDGSYRVELYVNGRLAGQAQATSSFGDLRAFAARDLTVALCRPPDWTEAEVSYAGLFNGYESPDKQSGVVLFRLGIPGRGRDEAELSVAVTDFVTEAFKDLFTNPPVAQGEPEEGYLLALAGTRWRTYDYGDGRLRTGAGVDPSDGSVFLVWVFGPYAWFDSPVPDQIVSSLSRYP